MSSSGFSFSKAIGRAIAGGARGVSSLFGREFGARAAAHASVYLAPVVTVQTSRGELRFACKSAFSAKRALRFHTHEPDTRFWIETHIHSGDHLWDVGANIGAYTLYTCLAEGVTVTAFEPVPSTYLALVENLELNKLTERVVALALALSNTDGILPLFLASEEAGSAMHALQEPRNVRGAFNPVGSVYVLASRGDTLVNSFRVTPPDHIKIDVDGHEAAVLEGMRDLLPSVRSVWIEMTDYATQTGENARIRSLLRQRGFIERDGLNGRNRLFVNMRPAICRRDRALAVAVGAGA